MSDKKTRHDLAQFAILATGLALLAMIIILYTTTLVDRVGGGTITVPSRVNEGG